MKTLRARTKKITLLSVLAAMLIACVAVFVCQTTTKAEAAEKTGEEPQITLVGANVSLDDSINIVYAAAVKGYDYTKYKTKLLVWTAWQDEYTKDNCDIIVDSSYHQNISAGSVVYSCDMFYYGVPAKKIVDQLYVKAYVEIDGKEVYSDTLKYSVLDYLYRMLGKTGITDYERRMYEAILKYGGRAQDLLDYLRNRRADDTFYSIHVENGTLSDGFTRGLFLENEEVVMTANAAPEGKKFAYWQDANGIILGYDEVLTVKATAANTYTAVFVDKITVSEQLHLTCSVSYDDAVEAVDLPDVINIKDDAGTVKQTINVTWDTTQFVSGKIGEQVLTATPKTEADKAALGSETVTMTVTVMPYSFQVDTVTGNYHITKYHNEANESRVVIPEKYRGQDIDTIDYIAFDGADSITDLYIPDTITKIAKCAFRACDNIETIRIPFIGDSMSTRNIFGYIFGTDSYEQQKAFVPTNLHKVIISDKVTEIAASCAFYGCKQITEIVLPSKLERITGSRSPQKTFAYTGITSISLPITIKDLGSGIFDGTDIQRVDVPDLNTYLQCSSASGFGGNADLYANGKLVTEVTIPGGMTQLGSVLSGVGSLKKVVIPDSITWISHNQGTFGDCKNLEEVVFEGESKITEMWGTFNGCSSLRTIHIPASVIEFVNSPFGGCNLESVYYDGTFEDWCKIDFAKYNSNGSPMPYTEKFYYKKENGYEELIDAVIPESITQINTGVFSGYKTLRSVTFHNGVMSIAKEAFNDCENLTSIVLPSQLRFLGEYAFYNCKSLYSINIPQSVTGIGSYAFNKCYNLAEVYNCSNLEFTIGSDSYGGIAKYAKVIHTDMSEPSRIVRDGDFAMYHEGDEYVLLGYFGEKTSLVLPDMATSINAYGFYGNDNITSVTLPSSLIEIKDDAFRGCDNLVEVINNSNLNIVAGSSDNGYVAYYAQKVLSGNEQKGEVFTVGDFNFYKNGDEYILYKYTGSSSVTSVTLPSFSEVGHTYKIGRKVFYYKNNIVKVTIPSCVTEIGEEAFYCPSLTSVVIPTSVTTIGEGAFYSCTSLTSVVIPTSVTIIGKQAFYCCTSLTSVVIPASVTTIGANAFANCSSLASVEFKNPEGWRRNYYGNSTVISAEDLQNTSTAAQYLTSKYNYYTWTREDKEGE